MTNPSRLFLDFETRSPLDITKVGGAKYARNCEPLMLGFALDDGQVHLWDIYHYKTMPVHLKNVFNDHSVQLIAHNSPFDRAVMKHAFGVDTPRERWLDTATVARWFGLPAQLEKFCKALGMPEDKAKSKDGRALIRQFSIPEYDDPTENPADWARFCEYCKQDVSAMRDALSMVPEVNDFADEHKIWCLDQKINERGLPIDLDSVKAIKAVVAEELVNFNNDLKEITDGDVTAVTQTAKMVKWLSTRNVMTKSLAKANVQELVGSLPKGTPSHRVLSIRQEAGKSSTSKYDAMEAMAVKTNGVHRIYGAFQYYGASRTGRWSGRGVQFQNLPRGTYNPEETEVFIDAANSGLADLLDDNMGRASSSIRGMVQAPKGRKFPVSDLANIEGRVLPWLAGEQWKLDAFKEYDEGTGPDLYKLSYSKAFGVPVDEVTKDQRFIGKVMELALGYQGGVNALLTMARSLGFTLDEFDRLLVAQYPKLIETSSVKNVELAGWIFEQSRDRTPLFKTAFVAADLIKQNWRNAHPNVVSFWDALENAFKAELEVGLLAFEKEKVGSNTWVSIKLPNGRKLYYFKPENYGKKLHYHGNDSGQFTRLDTYGGKLAENITQAVARDVMAENMPYIEEAGYNILGTVHDEVITETPDTSWYSAEALSELLCAPHPWTEGLPLAAEGSDMKRYRK